MSIEVHVSTFVSSLRTCIKVLTEHIVCRLKAIILKYNFLLSASLSLTHSVYFILCVFCCHPVCDVFSFRTSIFTQNNKTF